MLFWFTSADHREIENVGAPTSKLWRQTREYKHLHTLEPYINTRTRTHVYTHTCANAHTKANTHAHLDSTWHLLEVALWRHADNTGAQEVPKAHIE